MALFKGDKLNSSLHERNVGTATERKVSKRDLERLSKPAYLDMSNISGSALGAQSNILPELMFQGNMVGPPQF